MDTSIALNGVLAAERNLEQAARKISTAGRTSSEPANTLEWTDFPAEMVAVDRAGITAKANLKVISKQAELLQETLDLYA